MSPEQAEGKPVDARSDVFSLGIVMYEMATGERPFKGDTAISTITSILRDNPVSIGELKPEMPRHLGRLVQRCLAKEPDRRYQAALDVRNELEGLRTEVNSGEVDATISGVAIKLPKPSAPSRKLLPIGIAVVALLVLVTAGVVLWPKLRGGSSPVAAEASGNAKSIAVLPFVNMSENAQNDYFSDGLSEELLNVLAKVPGLKVAARTSSFHFKGATGNVADIGRQLGVATILEGSVRRSGNRVRITAELINAADGFQLWSETYDRELNDIFAIQENIAGEVVGALKIKLLGAGQAATQAASKPTANVEAYEAYLLGQQKMTRRTSESLTEAAAAFQKAIDLDPNYALAYVGLSDATQRLNEYSNLSGSEMLARAEPLARKALALDDKLGEAYASLASLDAFKGNFAAAEIGFQKAIELSPNYAMAYMWYGQLLQASDRMRAIKMLEKALELDPLSPPVNANLGYSYQSIGRADDAIARFKKVTEIEPGFMGGWAGLSSIYLDVLSQPEEGLEYQRRAIEADPGNLTQQTVLAERLAQLGRWDEALATCRKVIERNPAFPQAYMEMGLIYSRRGELDEAVRWHRKAVERDPDSNQCLGQLFGAYLDVADVSAAQDVARRLTALQPDGMARELTGESLDIFLGKMDEAEAQARRVWNNVPDFVRADMWMFDMRAGKFADARDRYRQSNPELFSTAEPVVMANNLTAAIDIAAAELKLGDSQHAQLLLKKCEAFIASRDEANRRATYRADPVQLYAVMGRKDEAIAALRRAIDDGFRSSWWRFQVDPTLDSIRDDPRFVAMMMEVRKQGQQPK
jgi:TolB-like protein/Tfp pilus assembly protein PilF